MLSSFYYYSLANPDHLHKGICRLNIISAAISSLIKNSTVVLLESTNPAPAAS